MAHIYWNGVAGAERYDLIEGDLDQVITQDGMLRLGAVRVLQSGTTATSLPREARVTYRPSESILLLAQYRDSSMASGWGTESSPWPAEPTSCDLSCPEEAIGTSIASSGRHQK